MAYRTMCLHQRMHERTLGFPNSHYLFRKVFQLNILWRLLQYDDLY